MIFPELTQTLAVPEPPKPSFPKWPFIAILVFLLGIASVFVWQQFLPTRRGLVGPSPSPVSVVGWGTYTNAKYGFSVKYDPNNQPVEIVGTGQQLALISFGTMKNNGFDIEISTGDKFNHVSGTIDKEEKITVGGILGTKLTYKQVIVIDEFEISRVIINKNDRDYIITALASDIDQILATFKFVDNAQRSLRPADSQTPASGICAQVQGPGATITVDPDNVSQPRCIQVSANQTLTLVNNSPASLFIDETEIKPGTSYQFPEPVGSFLAPGVHKIAGAEIWLP